MCPVGRQSPVFCLPVVISEDGEIAGELLFTGLDGLVRQRRACFVELTDGIAYRQNMLIVEGRAASVRPKIVAVDSAELKRAIEIVAPNRR